ncbi:hypothetical protein [Thermosipho globiformans]|uniref:hypothetical protein n=1 Tax=Thermosipho globiformans TaxID=380685 RepID=UPI000F8D9C30|nr:hypothetical protein [Thermosipho globiformans]
MIAGLFFWIFPFFLISFDLAFSDLFLSFMMFFFLESVNNFSFEKALRYVVFLSLYTMVIFKDFNLIYIFLIFLIILIESYRDSFLKIWILPLLEAFIFYSLFLINGNLKVVIISILISLLIYIYLIKKGIIKFK